LFFRSVYFLLVVLSLAVSVSAVPGNARVSEMIYFVSCVTLNSANSLTQSVTRLVCLYNSFARCCYRCRAGGLEWIAVKSVIASQARNVTNARNAIQSHSRAYDLVRRLSAAVSSFHRMGAVIAPVVTADSGHVLSCASIIIIISSFYLNQATWPININKRHTDRQTDRQYK